MCSGLCWQFLNKPDILFFWLIAAVFFVLFCGIDFSFFFFPFTLKIYFSDLGYFGLQVGSDLLNESTFS